MRAYDAGKGEIGAAVRSSIANGAVAADIRGDVDAIASRARIPADELPKIILDGTCKAIDAIVEDGILSESEERAFNVITTQLGVGASGLPQPLTNKLVMARVLREILEGRVPPCQVQYDGPLPFMLQKSESLVWLEKDVPLTEETSRTQYSGGSRGTSVRLAKGLSFRVGAGQGEYRQVSSMERKDIGLLGITTKHLYYAGHRSSFRIPYAKIMSCNTYADAISITTDAVRAKPRIFGTDNVWFIYNAIMNLSQLEAQ
ncbi:MAG: hypothetical protein ACR2HJ_11965 [Fimbriimonadales bacterium]